MFALLSNISVVCCSDALYQFGYMDFLSKDQLFDDCRIDLPFARSSLRNCAFYLNNRIRPKEYNRLCFNCKFNFLNSVSVTFHKIKKNAACVSFE